MGFLPGGSGDQAPSDPKAAVSPGADAYGGTVPWPGGSGIRPNSGQAGVRSGQGQVPGRHHDLV